MTSSQSTAISRYFFVITAYFGFICFLMAYALVPVAVGLSWLTYDRIKKRMKKDVRNQSVWEVVKKNVDIHTKFVPATQAGRQKVAGGGGASVRELQGLGFRVII
jgi:hypothetical protein